MASTTTSAWPDASLLATGTRQGSAVCADDRLVPELIGLRLGVFGKGAFVVSVLLVALCGVVWVSVNATRDATRGADSTRSPPSV